MKQSLTGLFLLFLSAAMAQPAAAFGGGSLPAFTDLVKENGRAVVNISTTQNVKRARAPRMPDVPEDSPLYDFFKYFQRELPQDFNVNSLGSGFVISPDGYILTCAHVIANASEIIVRLTDRREFEAKVVGMDERADVGLLKIEASDLPVLHLGDPSKLEVGEWVLAIGAPFGFENSATAGIVSAKGRSLPNESYVPFIQTDVAINPGNSGGPLFNLKGEVVGINAQIYSRTGGFMGLSFAVPIDLAMSVADQLRKDGHVKRGWLGVRIQNVTRELAQSFGMKRPSGALVSEITAGGPAARSDLKVGDVIVEFNGKHVDESSDLPPLVGLTPVGEAATLKVIRDGKAREIKVTIGELPEQKEQQARAGPEPAKGAELLGMTLRDLTKDERKELGIDTGVLVLEVEQGPARSAGLRPGDVILQIDRKAVGSVSDARGALTGLEKGRSVPLLVRRDDGSLFLVLKVPKE